MTAANGEERTEEGRTALRSQRPSARDQWHALLARRTTPEPTFAAMMHVIARLASGAPPETELEKECAHLYHDSPEPAQKDLAHLAREYMSLPLALRARTAPAVLVRLPPTTPLSHDLLQSAFAESARLATSLITPIVMDASQGHAGEIRLLGQGFTGGEGTLSVTVRTSQQANAVAMPVELREVTAGMIRLILSPALQQEAQLQFHVLRSFDSTALFRDALFELDKTLFPPAPFPAPVLLPPKITKVEPEDSRPGESILIDGENFKPYVDLNGCSVHIEELDRQTGFAAHVFANAVEDKEGWRASVVSPTQIKFRFGFNIPPGRYIIRVSDSTTNLMSDFVPYKIAPWKFRVNFLNFSCTDESNEASGSDEIVTAWAVAADEFFYLKRTGEYDGVDEGGTYDYSDVDRSVLTPTGTPHEVKQVLSVVTRLYEWDDSSSSRMQSSEDSSYKIAQALQSSGNSTAQAAAAVIVLADLLASSVSSLSSSADPLGEQQLVWTAPELLKMTNNAQRRFEGELHFDNPDSEGSHIVRYEVLREF